MGERVKLLVQNQNKMIKQGRLDRPYDGVVDCCKRTMDSEGVAPFWRGNLANVLRYFPTQALNFAFKDTIKAAFATPKSAPQWQKFATNIASGGFAGSLSLTVVYSLDFGLRRYWRSLPRFRHLLRRYLHLPRFVLWTLRFFETNHCWRLWIRFCLLLPRLVCHYCFWFGFLPNRYHPTTNDDDQWWWC